MLTRPSVPRLAALLLLAAASARADGGFQEPRHRLIATTFTVGRVYPIGLDQQVTLTLKQRIGDSEDLLFKTRFWSIGAMGGWNPANWTARVEALVEPIAVFQLRLSYDARGYFGNYGALLTSSDPLQCITDACIEAATNADQDYPGVVQGLTVEPILQAAIGPVAVRNTFDFEYNWWGARAGDLYVYDPGPDFLRAVQGWTLTDNATLGYLDPHLFAGALYQWINPVGVPGGNAVHRVGAIATYTFFDRGAEHGWFNKPTVVALALWSLQHRGRAGPIPTVVVAFTTETDFLPSVKAPSP